MKSLLERRLLKEKGKLKEEGGNAHKELNPQIIDAIANPPTLREDVKMALEPYVDSANRGIDKLLSMTLGDMGKLTYEGFRDLRLSTVGGVAFGLFFGVNLWSMNLVPDKFERDFMEFMGYHEYEDAEVIDTEDDILVRVYENTAGSRFKFRDSVYKISYPVFEDEEFDFPDGESRKYTNVLVDANDGEYICDGIVNRRGCRYVIDDGVNSFMTFELYSNPGRDLDKGGLKYVEYRLGNHNLRSEGYARKRIEEGSNFYVLPSNQEELVASNYGNLDEFAEVDNAIAGLPEQL